MIEIKLEQSISVSIMWPVDSWSWYEFLWCQLLNVNKKVDIWFFKWHLLFTSLSGYRCITLTRLTSGEDIAAAAATSRVLAATDGRSNQPPPAAAAGSVLEMRVGQITQSPEDACNPRLFFNNVKPVLISSKCYWIRAVCTHLKGQVTFLKLCR